MPARASTRDRAAGSPSRGPDAGGAPALLALTGGIGAGKSTALAALGRLGAATLSSDEVVAGVYRDPAVAGAVRGRFGTEAIAANGGVDRAALATMAFSQPDGIEFLESLIHPHVADARRSWVEDEMRRRPPPPVLVCEVPLLFEVGAERDFDAVLVVTAPEAIRRERVSARGQDFDGRRARQIPEDDKVARGDEVFVNDRTEADLEAWAGQVFAKYSKDTT